MDAEEVTNSAHPSAIMPVDVRPALVNAIDALPDGLLLMDQAYRLTYVNERGRKIIRVRPEHLHGPTHWEVFPETVGTDIELVYRRVMNNRIAEELETYYAPLEIWLKICAFPMGEGIAVHFADVTATKTALQEREAVAKRIREVMEVTADAVFAIDRNWTIRYLNRAARNLTSLAGDAEGREFFGTFPDLPDAGAPNADRFVQAMHHGLAASFETSFGPPLNVRMQVEVKPSDEGILVFCHDVTKLRGEEAALRTSEERYRALAELGPLGVWTADASGHVNYVNPAMVKYLGLSGSDRGGSDWAEAYLPEDRAWVRARWAHSIATGEPYSVSARLPRAGDGAQRWWRVRAVPMYDEAGAITQWLGVADDIDELTRAAERLQVQQAETERKRLELQAVYDNAPVGLALFDPVEYRYLDVNRRQCEIIDLPREQVLGHRLQEVVASPAITETFDRIAKGESIRDKTVVTDLRARPGEMRTFNVNYAPVLAEDGSVRAISVAVLEITQLRKAEAALMQSEKLAAVGRLASSISHEINNPLEAVTNLLYIAVNDPHMSDEIRSYLALAQDELRRVGQIATQTLRFHRQADNPTAVTAAQLIDPVLNLYAGRLVNSGIHVEASYSTARKMLCFENDIRQVLNNLIANAIDAMRGGGRLLIRAHDACDLRSAAPGVRIAVADTGHGMRPETLQKIFEPFYTTKGMNGNGLGLWISKGIVERHQGHLRLRSSQDPVGHGTAFTLFLPAAD